VAEARGDVAAFVKAATAPVMCSRCGVQPRRHLNRLNGVAGSDMYCGDCFVDWIEECDGDTTIATPADYSGEAHMDALQSWLRRPMGVR